MNYVQIISLVSKQIGLTSSLLLALCSHESGLKNITNQNDHGSPSIGVCQIKEASMHQIGFKGTRKQLEQPYNNILWAGKYLKHQLERYSWNYCKGVSAFNSGTYHERKGLPRNFKYVKAVQKLIKEKSVAMMLECKPFSSDFMEALNE